MFPSLSGKTFIRTPADQIPSPPHNLGVSIPFREDLHSDVSKQMHLFQETKKVSIPFREDLHSDSIIQEVLNLLERRSFHPFQGRPSFGPLFEVNDPDMEKVKVSIPFREDLHSDRTESHVDAGTIQKGFHPFQGRPSFGRQSGIYT